MARYWSREQASDNRMSHNPDFSCQITGWSSIAENVGYTTANSTPEDVAIRLVNAWIASPHHNANLVNSKYTQTGVGVWQSSNGTWYATQNFRN